MTVADSAFAFALAPVREYPCLHSGSPLFSLFASPLPSPAWYVFAFGLEAIRRARSIGGMPE
jgi:hypothetical protein